VIVLSGNGRIHQLVNNLPMCEALLSVSLTGIHHGFIPTMLHILKRGNGIRKLVLETCNKLVIGYIFIYLYKFIRRLKSSNISKSEMKEISLLS
jgi:hypothetical protein